MTQKIVSNLEVRNGAQPFLSMVMESHGHGAPAIIMEKQRENGRNVSYVGAWTPCLTAWADHELGVSAPHQYR